MTINLKIPNENGTEIPFDERLVNQLRGKSLLYPYELGNEIRVLCRMLDGLEEENLQLRTVLEKIGNECISDNSAGVSCCNIAEILDEYDALTGGKE